jgi:hypothetical protein
MDLVLILAVAGAVGTTAMAALAIRVHNDRNALRARFAKILDVEGEVERIRDGSRKSRREADATLAQITAEIATLREQYSVGRTRHSELLVAVTKLEENLEDIESGFYRPHFTYEDSEAYKDAISEIRTRQKDIAKRGGATLCATTWQVGGSAKEGERMVRQTEKLLLRAFNAEAEAAVSNVSWNNYETMQARISKAREVLNKHGTVLQVSLTEEYCDARLTELKLVYEAAEKRKQERDEQREQRAALKEEEKVQRELERAQEDAAREEAKYAKVLEKARAELLSVREEERASLNQRVAELEAALTAAHDRKERALAQAQLTRVGHVYVISNLGAFGDGVVKIGMTRRLEPEERVKELGDASVPFPFDLHALIYSEDAPALETKLHEHFWDRRLNWSNDRKEFFHVTLHEIQGAIRSFGLSAELTHVAEAREYRETVAIRRRTPGGTTSDAAVDDSPFPADPFSAPALVQRPPGPS